MLLAMFLQGEMRGAEAGEEAHFPFSRHNEYAKGTIRVSEPGQAVQDAAVVHYYERWKADYLVKVEEGKWRVAFGKSAGAHQRTVSEGQGYGLVIAAIMAGQDAQAREIFDGLWRFARAHPSGIEKRLMAWEIPSAGGESADSAFDGDMDIAYGLLLADRQWGSAGEVNYRAEALQVIAGIKAATIGPKSRLPLLGDWVKGSEFTEWQTRTSDFMMGHFRAFGRVTGDPVWGKVVETTQRVVEELQGEFSPETGLLPDFVVPQSADVAVVFRPKPARPKFLEEKTDGDFAYNACRVPWRLATDVLLNNDAKSRQAVEKMSRWMEKSTGGDPLQICAGYRLDGESQRKSDYFSAAFAAPFGVAAMVVPAQQVWLNRIYEAVHAKHENYYEDSLNLLSLLVMTGHFWDPTLVE